MNEQGIKKFLLSLGVKSGEMRTSRSWVNAPCPMAPYMHGSGVDEHPSFGISISEGRSAYYCFGCHPKAQLLEGLLHNIFIMSGAYPWEAADVFVHEENWEADEGMLAVPDRWIGFKGAVDPLPKQVVRLFPFLQSNKTPAASACRKYLEGRGIPEWIQNMYQVRFDPERGCLVFALADSSGRVFILRERSIKEKRLWTVSPKIVAEMVGRAREFYFDESDLFINRSVVEFPKLRDVGVWFGMPFVNWSKPMILVEGEIDAMRLAVLGEFNTIASATSSVSEAQIEALHAITLYLGYDSDEAGALAHHRIAENIKDRAVMFELDWGVVGRKDPGELKNKWELEKVMKNARPI